MANYDDFNIDCWIFNQNTPEILINSNLSQFPNTKNTFEQHNKLSPSILQPNEELMLKRKKQNEAARRCRQKKEKKLQQLKDRAHNLEYENKLLSLKVNVLEAEKESWLLKEAELVTELQMKEMSEIST